jgi:hypothetical protein
MSQTLTIRIPDALFNQLKRAAELARQPADTIIAQSLAHSLPPLLEEIPFQYQPDVFPLLQDERRKFAERDESHFSARALGGIRIFT